MRPPRLEEVEKEFEGPGVRPPEEEPPPLPPLLPPPPLPPPPPLRFSRWLDREGSNVDGLGTVRRERLSEFGDWGGRADVNVVR